MIAPTDEDLAVSIRTTAELLHTYIRQARQRGLSVTFRQPVHHDTWEVNDVQIIREL